MLKKLCSYTGCNELVDYSIKYCDKHKDIVDKNKKDSYREYKQRRMQDEQERKRQSFYNDKNWIKLRQAVMAHYKGLDIYEYYVNHKIVYADIVHHIRTTKDMWDMRLVFSNMFPCSKATHNYLHSIYDSSSDDKDKMQRLLLQLINRFDEEFGTVH